MRILYVCHEPLPSTSTSTEQVIKASSAMVQAGVRVDVVCPRRTRQPWGPERLTEIARFYDVPAQVFEDGLGVLECRVPDWVLGPLYRPWHDVAAVLERRAQSHDVIYTRDPFSLVTGLLSDRPVIFETYRYDLNQRVAFGPWRLFCLTHPNLLGVITHSAVSAESFLSVGVPPDRVLIAHNGYDGPLPDELSAPQARTSLGLPERNTIVYTGHVAHNKGIDALVQIATALPTWAMVILGHVPGSSGERYAQRLIRDAGVRNVRMIPRVSPSAVPQYLAAATCLVIPPTARPLEAHGRTVLPMKTFQYLAAGRPIVAPDLPDVQEVLRHNENAVLVPPDNPGAAVKALESLATDGNFRERLSTAARSTARQFTWKARAAKVAPFVAERLAVWRHRSGYR